MEYKECNSWFETTATAVYNLSMSVLKKDDTISHGDWEREECTTRKDNGFIHYQQKDHYHHLFIPSSPPLLIFTCTSSHIVLAIHFSSPSVLIECLLENKEETHKTRVKWVLLPHPLPRFRVRKVENLCRHLMRQTRKTTTCTPLLLSLTSHQEKIKEWLQSKAKYTRSRARDVFSWRRVRWWIMPFTPLLLLSLTFMYSLSLSFLDSFYFNRVPVPADLTWNFKVFLCFLESILHLIHLLSLIHPLTLHLSLVPRLPLVLLLSFLLSHSVSRFSTRAKS